MVLTTDPTCKYGQAPRRALSQIDVSASNLQRLGRLRDLWIDGPTKSLVVEITACVVPTPRRGVNTTIRRARNYQPQELAVTWTDVSGCI